VTVPSAPIDDPPCCPFELSTSPIAASVVHERRQAGMLSAFAMAAPA
jgi:hypothetical protein